ncbi:hypothetical protein BH10BDE1_BH10BDE1_21980 [soil metagenome]
MKSSHVIFLLAMILVPILTTISQADAQAAAPARPAPVTAPRATAPVRPVVAVPTTSGAAAAPVVATSRAAHANLIAAAFDEAAFKKATDAGQTVIVFFAGAGDAIWEKQAPLLAVILRETEFNRIPAYQADVANSELTAKLLVKSAGTILVFKGGVERLRSTRMVKADPIRKMLRLNTAL